MKELKEAYTAFRLSGDAIAFLAAAEAVASKYALPSPAGAGATSAGSEPVKWEQLHLICFVLPS